jgi:hypothetical protein
MATDISSPPNSAGTVLRGRARPPRFFWLITVVAVCASLVLGASVQHFFDQRNAARSQYRMQVLTTISRFLDEEGSQVAQPVSHRSAAAFGALADSISQDQGVNGSGTLTVSLGAGSATPPSQVAFSVTVASPYGSATIATWYISMTSGGGSSINEGACVLSSSLLGSGGDGRATAPLSLGGGAFVQQCESRWWSPGPVTATQPRLGLAGIPESAGQ